ncbi:diacylglycerol kinase [Helicobacter sp. 12S02634-8]|uniref:diacylglycerol kinase n=1 Tax=Helicobacter sp. 12S02634-8 TaxID=1476199 RepID=UPI000BA65874|nr:diacylglycerol kinase [Helicobacter sp. 12S02634-8]PAF47138.1 diacylglycerol kinase [Helicobacter sp. 12S02634-8]
MEPDKNTKKGKKGFERVVAAFFYSKDGLSAAWREEAAFRQVLILAILCGIAAIFVGRSWVEWVLLVLPCVLSVLVELINSAIENAIDFTSTNLHPLAKKAKDMGSAAQLVALVFWVGVWIGFLWWRYV